MHVHYDSGMSADRLRKVRSVTLNPVLVDRLLAAGRAQGEENLSRLLDRCIEVYLSQVASPPKAKSTNPRRTARPPRQ